MQLRFIGGVFVYTLIESQMAACGISVQELAAMLDISLNQMSKKLIGAKDFTLAEATQIKRILNAPQSLEELFTS